MNKLNTQEFYELMQDYRNAPIKDQYLVGEKFDKVKSWISRNFKEIKDNRSNQMNRYYWGVVIKIFAGELGWETEEAHKFFKSEFLMSQSSLYLGVENMDNLEHYIEIKSTSELNNTEFIEYIKNIQQFSAEQGIVIPDPNEADYDKIYQMYKKD